MSSDDFVIEQGLDPGRMPGHIAMIMDGNGRWAKKRLLNRIKGHEKGADVVREMVRACRKLGISILTLYAFSTENWGRPKTEVGALMLLLRRFLVSEQEELIRSNIRFNTLGRTEHLPDDVQASIHVVKKLTRHNDGMTLNLALSYGGREEITRMVRQIARMVDSGLMTADAITERTVAEHLYTTGMADPDLLIRTSGEMRLSNFLLWQIAYAELFFTRTLWPDFNEAELIRILKDFQSRDRRYGQVD
ncbi:MULTISPECIES: isoprenyl transferase [Desulfococcus]|nr:isoprenyl transferase [Desulfococcus multivorans]AOY58038.1 UppS: undecaprenyl pyrophosphate synthase [Desulfococcus multivorans]MDX9817583.1 isoprenyl transferase [Desulfococcus multivorans]